MEKQVTIIGAGLAGCEAAYQCAKRGIKVNLIEMRPKKYPPAFHTDLFGELVCSNSLRSNSLNNAVGILKEELRLLDSLIIKAADASSVPAGSALAVDRESFSHYITDTIRNHENITVINEEITEIPEGPCIIATGPLTSDNLARAICEYLHTGTLHFYDAAAPIVEKDSIDFNKAYYKSRYDKGEASYINCPMDAQEFEQFYDALIHAQCAHLHDFEDEKYFEGCMPIEVMAKRGEDTIRFGPLKPVGFDDPRTGKRPYAIVQLRQDNTSGTLYNLVGFQTNLKFGEQKRVFSMIPGLEDAEFIKYGVMHRNTYINSPKLLNKEGNLRTNNNIFFAGQITGVEGYVESIASGLFAGINAVKELKQEEKIIFPKETVIGALTNYVSSPNEKFQPMNANFGILPPLEEKVKDKKKRYEKMAERSLNKIIQ